MSVISRSAGREIENLVPSGRTNRSSALFADECGHLLSGGAPLPGLSAIGAVASGLRPGPFTFAETVRQAYRGVLALPSRRPTRAFGG